MGLSAHVVSSDFITDDTLNEFCVGNGGVLIDEANKTYSFTYEHGNLWVTALGDEEPLSEDEIKEYELMLGKMPQSQILFEVGWASGSEQEYLKLVLKMMEKWNCIVCDLNEKLVSREGVKSRLEAILKSS